MASCRVTRDLISGGKNESTVLSENETDRHIRLTSSEDRSLVMFIYRNHLDLL